MFAYSYKDEHVMQCKDYKNYMLWVTNMKSSNESGPDFTA